MLVAGVRLNHAQDRIVRVTLLSSSIEGFSVGRHQQMRALADLVQKTSSEHGKKKGDPEDRFASSLPFGRVGRSPLACASFMLRGLADGEEGTMTPLQYPISRTTVPALAIEQA